MRKFGNYFSWLGSSEPHCPIYQDCTNDTFDRFKGLLIVMTDLGPAAGCLLSNSKLLIADIKSRPGDCR
jgi:hypothetical protein